MNITRVMVNLKVETKVWIFVVCKNCSCQNTLDVKMMRMEMMIAQSEAREPVSPVLLSCELTTDVRWPETWQHRSALPRLE